MAYKKSNPNGQATMANSEPVVLASDHSDVKITLDGETVSGTVTANAGTNLNTSALALETGGNLASIKTNTDTIAGDTTAIQTAVELIDDAVYTDGAGTPSKGVAVMGTDGTNPQILSTNASGHLNIADGGNTITVDGTVGVSGTVTVDLGVNNDVTVTNATAANLKAEVVGTGTFVTQENGAALTALQLIDDVVYVDDTATHATGTSKGVGMMAVASPTDTSVNANDIGMIAMTTDRQQMVRATVASGGIASGAIASGAIASGAIASGAIATGAIAAGTASIAQTEDTAHSTGEHLVKVGARRIDTAAVSSDTSGDWSTFNQSAEGAQWVTTTPTTTSGCTIFRSIDLDESEEEIKATAGNMYGYYFANTNASARYLKFYNATAANVTVGTTTPVMTLYLPGSSAGHIGFTYPVGFSTAITAAATTGVADNDTGAPGANEVIINVFYK